jgi:hypothetical protein
MQQIFARTHEFDSIGVVNEYRWKHSRGALIPRLKFAPSSPKTVRQERMRLATKESCGYLTP